MPEVTTMSLFIVAFMVVAAVGVFFWLMVRPTADEEGSAVPRGTSDGATGRYSNATTDAQSHAPLAVHQRDHQRSAPWIGDSPDAG
jgi:hypothetical protein